MIDYFWMSLKPILRGHKAFSPAQLMLWRSVAPVPKPRQHYHLLGMTGSDRLRQQPCVIKAPTHLAAPLGGDGHQHALDGVAL